MYTSEFRCPYCGKNVPLPGTGLAVPGGVSGVYAETCPWCFQVYTLGRKAGELDRVPLGTAPGEDPSRADASPIYSGPEYRPRRNWHGVFLGLGIALVALLVSYATYTAASGGGVYFVFWGAAAWGLWIALKNLFPR